MGIIFRARIKFMVFVLSIFWQFSLHGQAILFPKANPKVKTLNEDPSSFGKKKKKSFQKTLAPPPTKQPSLKEKLEEEAKKPRPLNFLIETSPVYSKIVAADPYTQFDLDIGNIVTTSYRIPFKIGSSGTQWLGARLLSINGLGTYKNYWGRFNFNYYGLMYSIINIDVDPTSQGSKVDSYDRPFYGVRTGFSGIYRQVDSYPKSEQAFPKNFSSTKGGAVDYPGLFIEAVWGKIVYGALGFQLILGVQSGSQITTSYTGVSVQFYH